MTEKLYYEDAYLHEFSALVTACEAGKDGFLIELDRTAFFPEGGGQPADTGRIGEAVIRDVHEKNGRIWHYADRALEVGETVACAIDFEQRRRRMQNHSGEHVFSGTIHRLYGRNNVGFHMGADCMTVDFDGELTEEQLKRAETLANEAVRENLPIRVFFPAREELGRLSYRSKKELEGAVRLVEIPGVDLCACCAPHVCQTGEIGLIKLLSAERHRGGVRLELLCGLDALEDYRRRQAESGAVSRLLSVPKEQIARAVERQLEVQSAQKERIAALSLALAAKIADAQPGTDGNLVVFDELLDEVALRELTNLLMSKCRIAAVFSPSGDGGWRYIIGSRSVDLRAAAREINAGISGRGGGSPGMIQGRASADAAQIRTFLEKYKSLDTSE